MLICAVWFSVDQRKKREVLEINIVAQGPGFGYRYLRHCCQKTDECNGVEKLAAFARQGRFLIGTRVTPSVHFHAMHTWAKGK